MSGENFLTNARRLEIDLLHQEKSHFAMATVWGITHYMLGIPAALCAAVAAVLSSVDNQQTTAAWFSGIAAVLTAMLVYLAPLAKKAERHSAGVRCSVLRGRVMRCIELDLSCELDEHSLRDRLEKLHDDKAILTESAPHCGWIEYQLAKRSIKKGEHEYPDDLAA